MEQVFDLVNTILRRDVETKRRNLYIRGYKVVPLSSQAGVLEFVGNTTPLRYWLEKAHSKFVILSFLLFPTRFLNKCSGTGLTT